MSVTWTKADRDALMKQKQEEAKIQKTASELKRLISEKDALEKLIPENKFGVVERTRWRQITAKIKSLEAQLNVDTTLSIANTALATTTATAKSMTQNARALTRAAADLQRTSKQIQKQMPKMEQAARDVEMATTIVDAVTETMAQTIAATDESELDFKSKINTRTDMPVPVTFNSILPSVPTHE